MMQTAAVQKISEQNSLYKATLDRAYMIGYTDAINQDRSRRRAARERRERKKYFAMQKLNGVALLIFTAVAIKILEGGGCNNSIYNRSFRVIHAFIQRNVDYQ